MLSANPATRKPAPQLPHRPAHKRLLTLEDPKRFAKSRAVGAFLGLRPGRRESQALASLTARPRGRRRYSYASTVSADGRFVAFESDANDLVGGNTNGPSDVFVRDRLLGTTARLSVDAAGVQANNWSYEPSISGDGRLVAWRSAASNLVAGDTNTAADIFVRDLLTSSTTRASVAATGQQAIGASAYHMMSPDGRYVAFDSTAANLVLPDVAANDVFVRELAVVGGDRGAEPHAGERAVPRLPRAGRRRLRHVADGVPRCRRRWGYAVPAADHAVAGRHGPLRAVPGLRPERTVPGRLHDELPSYGLAVTLGS